MINQKRDPNLPSYFVSKLITRMNHFYQLKLEESHFLFKTYDRTDTKIQFDIKKSYTVNLVRSMRHTYRYLNKHKYIVFTYSEMDFWKVVSSKKREIIKTIYEYLDKDSYDEKRKKYLQKSISTINKYDDNHGLFIACIVNRLFYHDLARYILEYI